MKSVFFTLFALSAALSPDETVNAKEVDLIWKEAKSSFYSNNYSNALVEYKRLAEILEKNEPYSKILISVYFEMSQCYSTIGDMKNKRMYLIRALDVAKFCSVDSSIIERELLMTGIKTINKD